MTVFSPNSVTYDLDIFFSNIVKNATTDEVLDSFELNIEGEFTLISKRMQLDYIGWGFIIDVIIIRNDNGYVDESRFNISVPPILAVKENTRFIYPTTIIMDLIEEGFGNQSIQDILSKVSTNQPYTEIYAYNPFYIEIPVSVGDTIPYGVWNVTSESGIIVNGRVTSEETIVVGGVSYNTYLVNITEADILDAIREFINEEMTLPPGVHFNLGFYYDQGSGWLTKADMIGGGEISEDNETVLVSLDGDLDLRNAGTVMIQNKSYLDRMLGLPPFTFLAIDVFLIIAIIILRIKRS